MAKIRFGYSDDFTAKNSGVGINTTDPQANLDVIGAVKGQDLKVTGISSQTGYEGFLRADHQIEENTQLNFGQGINASLSGEIIVGTGQTVTVTENLKEDRLGPELITNGQFLSNVDDWTAFNSSNSFNNGRLRITRSGGDGRATYQLITNLVPGATYFASAIVDSIGSRGDFRIVNGNSWTSNYYLSISGTSGQVKTLSGSFTATGTTALVGFAIDNNSTLIEVDQVTVRRVNDVEEPGTNVAGGSQIECMKVYNTFTPPSGGINDRPSKPKPGQLYYNYDFKTIEFHDGYGWRQVDNTTRSGRALTSGGGTTASQYLDSFNINTLGNASRFGDMFQDRNEPAGFGDETRAVFGGGSVPNAVRTIDYNTIASEGNSIDFGDRTEYGYSAAAVSSSTRGVMAGGWSPGTPRSSNTEVIDFVEISTVGNALDFGDLKPGAAHGLASAQSPTRGIYAGGYWSTFPSITSPYSPEFIGSITIASKGNTIKFGELSVRAARAGGCSNSVRGIFAGGYKQPAPGYLSRIEYVTIASDGNGTIFGDLSTGRPGNAMTNTQTRAVIMGGRDDSTNDTNLIEYVTIASTGDAIDFGDLTIARRRFTATSDSHGGLGGF